MFSMVMVVHGFHGHGGSCVLNMSFAVLLFNMCIVGHCFIICHGGSCFYTSWWLIC